MKSKTGSVALHHLFGHRLAPWDLDAFMMSLRKSFRRDYPCLHALKSRNKAKHKSFGIRFSDFYEEAKLYMKSKGWKGRWT